MTSVLIVVLNWNGINDTEKCLDSLFNQTYQNFKILVIDNGSIDGSQDKLQEIANKHEDLVVIYNKKNKGFAGGVNTGIAYAINNRFDNVALINNDAIADKEWLSELTKETRKASIVTGLLLNSKGDKIDSTGEYYSVWGTSFARSRGRSAMSVEPSDFVFGATGGASLYKTSLFKEIGLFDESFFAYFEDADISFRAQLADHKVYFTNRAIAYHQQGATSKKIPGFTVYQTFKNIPLLFIKNVPAGLFLPIGFRLLVLYILFFGNAVKNGTGFSALKGWLASIGYFWIRSLWLRIGIQSKRKVPTSYINSIILHDLAPDQTGMRKFRKFFTGKA
ncbi:MAG: glycosyltransferase family 2 protein [Candidatus Saccharimonadales bacterium]